MGDIKYKLSSSDPNFTHLDLREVDVDEEELKNVADEAENNAVISRVSWKEGYIYDEFLKRRIVDKVKLNNRTFQRHPSDFILGLFSCHAYTDSEVDTSVEFASNSGDANAEAWNEELKNWRVFRVFNHPESGRYYSVAYVNEGKKQLVLAHRGTKFQLWDFAEHESPLKTDLEGILDGKIVKQQEEAYAATEKVVKHAKENGHNVSFTGHSLGAWLAELSLYFAVNNFDFLGKAVTFDSPGSASTMDSFKPNVISHGNKPEISNLNITTYLSAPNLVNCCNPHVGKVFRIFPDITWINNTDKLRSIMKKAPLAEHFEPVITSLLSIDGHSIEPMIATFNPLTGKPETSEKVLDWPCFKYEPKTIKTTARKVIENTFTSFVSLLEFLPGIGWLVEEVISKSTFITFVKTIDDFISGDINSYEFRKAYKSSEFVIMGREGTVPLTSAEKFILRYEGHYSTEAFNPFKDHYNPESTDFYLNELCKWSTGEIDKMKICEDLKQSLHNLKASFEIKFEPVSCRKYICSKSSETDISTLREKIERLCEIYCELKDVFDDKNAFLPQNKPPTQTGKITGNLPVRPAKYLERLEIMEEIGEVLDKHKLAVISAFGGTGKSTIAAEYGRDLQKKVDGQIVRIIEGDSLDKINAAYKMIAEIDLEINVQNLSAINVMQSVHGRIANTESSILLIFDNVERYEDVEAYIGVTSNTENVKVIITTRHIDLSKDLQNINLNPFTREEATSYIKNATGDRFSPQDIDKLLDNIASENFYLPYTLSHIVAYFKQNPLYKIELCIEHIAKTTGETGTFLLLDLINTSELSWLILQYSAYLDPDFISTDIFKELLSVDEDRLQAGVQKLESLGLMSFRRLQNGQCGLKIHRLLQDLVRSYAHANEGLSSVINEPDIFERTMEVLYNLHPCVTEAATAKRAKTQNGCMYDISLHIKHIINNFLFWLCECDKLSNIFVGAEKAKPDGQISDFGPLIRYIVASDRIAIEGPKDKPVEEGSGCPQGVPPLWLVNLQAVINRASCRVSCKEIMNSVFRELTEFKGKFNNQTFQFYPNGFVLGFLSFDACTGSKKETDEESSNSDVTDDETCDEELIRWKVPDVLNEPESSSYSDI